jgi:hypothetical protein
MMKYMRTGCSGKYLAKSAKKTFKKGILKREKKKQGKISEKRLQEKYLSNSC